MNYILVRSEDYLEHKLFGKTDKTNSDGSRKIHKYIERIKTKNGYDYIYPEDREGQRASKQTEKKRKQTANNIFSRFADNVSDKVEKASKTIKKTYTKAVSFVGSILDELKNERKEKLSAQLSRNAEAKDFVNNAIAAAEKYQKDGKKKTLRYEIDDLYTKYKEGKVSKEYLEEYAFNIGLYDYAKELMGDKKSSQPVKKEDKTPKQEIDDLFAEYKEGKVPKEYLEAYAFNIGLYDYAKELMGDKKSSQPVKKEDKTPKQEIDDLFAEYKEGKVPKEYLEAYASNIGLYDYAKELMGDKKSSQPVKKEDKTPKQEIDDLFAEYKEGKVPKEYLEAYASNTGMYYYVEKLLESEKAVKKYQQDGKKKTSEGRS